MCKNIAHNGIFIDIVAFFLKKKTFSWDFFVNEIGQKLNKFLKT